ncbi:MAG: hypothetical protein EOR68_08375 [Mesorhizobium sp.]|uniref:hypothetical protein n=1 Tax=Mesorhizobium sp. TaxID=1871066 RepID=UPI000FE4578A|nr:hypothetical protein [Mesorhizobium sp.]RWM02113.1 MAG: hypothetical protein EOR68_08375 [Mesorhizobium sp.]
MSDVSEFATISGYTTYTESKDYKTGSLRIVGGSTLRVLNGSKVTFDCEVLILDGKITIDTHGVDGRDGLPGADCPLDAWYSGLSHNDYDRRHREWLEAKRTPNPSENGGDCVPGTDGTDAGHVRITYRKLGDSTDLGSFDIINLAGGKSGRGVSGGNGRLLICGYPAHRQYEQWRRPSGASWWGKDGADGTFHLVRADGTGKSLEVQKLGRRVIP